MEFDAAAWSGEGAFTQALVDVLRAEDAIVFLKVEDAPASRSDSAFSFISNEIYVGFARKRAAGEMLQYLRTERIVPAYQTRGFKVIEMVRIYELGTPSRA